MSCLPDDIIESVISYVSAKETWSDLVYIFEGPSDTKENRIMDMKLEYQTFRAKSTQSLSQTYTRYKTLLSEVDNDGGNLSKYKINVGFVNSLLEKWLTFSQGPRNANHTRTLDLADIYERFIYEDNLIQIREPIWYLDSGCSRSMTGVKSYLYKYVRKLGPKVVFDDNSSCITEGYGSINYGVYSKEKHCTTCEKGKNHRASFKTKQNFSIRECLHLLHMDVFGTSVAMSLVEAEYVAATGCYASILWMKSQLNDYDIHYKMVPIFCDNTSAVAISNNPALHSRTKHIDIRYQFIRDHILKGDIKLHFISIEYQLADIFTKPLDETAFTRLKAKLGMLNSD
nr:retrovirus-related Pol polyprotein from transposon TNT 1-94 [Tanacetum cinerariifolium]